MKTHLIIILLATIFICPNLTAKNRQNHFPPTIFSGEQDRFHCQGIAYDHKHQCVYMSFTTSLIKVGLDGRLLGSVTGLTGHLGGMSLNPDDGRLYASLEYKHDAIGKGIQAGTGAANSQETGFYIAIFDVDKITSTGMDATSSGIMTTVYVREAVEDYNATVCQQGHLIPHRYGCSGIDGLTFAPQWGKSKGKQMLYVAYGIYADKTRTDNDYQVILSYDVSHWQHFESPLTPDQLHHHGPERPTHKYFVYTGNTEWGIQNLCYDSFSRTMLAATYKGRKDGWTAFPLFTIDHRSKPHREVLRGVEPQTEAEMLHLADIGLKDDMHGTRGWDFPWGSTGITSLGQGLFYVSHNGKTDGREHTTLHLYRWNLSDTSPMQEETR